MDGNGADGRTAGDWSCCSMHLRGGGMMEAWTGTAGEPVTSREAL